MQSDDTPAWATELRAFTEFSLRRLEERMSARFDGIDGRIDCVDARLSAFENRVMRKFDGVDARLESLEHDAKGKK